MAASAGDEWDRDLILANFQVFLCSYIKFFQFLFNTQDFQFFLGFLAWKKCACTALILHFKFASGFLNKML